MSTAMDESRFAALADSYGADLARWPPAERDAAAQLLAESAATRALLQRQSRLDGLLASIEPPPAPAPQLRRDILAAVPTARPSWFAALWAELGGARRAGPMLAGAMLLGIALTPLAAPVETVVIEETDDYTWSDEDYEELVP